MMNAQQPPAADGDHVEPYALTLVLPEHLDRDQMLRGLVEAIGQIRVALANRTCLFRNWEDRWAAHGDQIRQSLCHGESLATEDAVLIIDEAIIEAFGLWEQFEAQMPGLIPGPGVRAEPPAGGQVNQDAPDAAAVQAEDDAHWREAATLRRDHPGWVVVWIASAREFRAYRRLPGARRDARLAAPTPGDLSAQITAAERASLPPSPGQ
jgi:hypothetical protein